MDRVVLDVGGQLFKTTRTTLSQFDYFARMFGDNWREGEDDLIFLDRDPDTFQVLLSYLRCGPGHAASLLPKEPLPHPHSNNLRSFERMFASIFLTTGNK